MAVLRAGQKCAQKTLSSCPKWLGITVVLCEQLITKRDGKAGHENISKTRSILYIANEVWRIVLFFFFFNRLHSKCIIFMVQSFKTQKIFRTEYRTTYKYSTIGGGKKKS